MTMHVQTFLREAEEIAATLDHEAIERMAVALSKITGTVHVIGLGGSLANAIHFAADLQKLCWIEAQAPNLALMSAWINDSGPSDAFNGMVTGPDSHEDALFVLSVGGGHSNVSPAISLMVKSAKLAGMKVFGIVGPHGGYTAEHGDHVIRIPVLNGAHVTPHTEAFQAVVWHALVSHPLLQRSKTKW